MPFIGKILKKFARQKMLTWVKTNDDPYGKPVYADPQNPVISNVRWEDKQVEILLPDGRTVRSKAYILSSVFIPPGSLLFLGSGVDPASDWRALPTYPNLPTVTQGAREVLVCDTTPDLKAQEFLYEVYV